MAARARLIERPGVQRSRTCVFAQWRKMSGQPTGIAVGEGEAKGERERVLELFADVQAAFNDEGERREVSISLQVIIIIFCQV